MTPSTTPSSAGPLEPPQGGDLNLIGMAGPGNGDDTRDPGPSGPPEIMHDIQSLSEWDPEDGDDTRDPGDAECPPTDMG